MPVPDGVAFSAKDYPAVFTLRLKNGAVKSVDMGITEDVPQVCPISRDRLLVFGRVAGGDGPFLWIISQIDGTTLDDIGGRDPIVSPDQQWIIYRRWFGQFYEIKTDEYFVYDLSATPAQNASRSPGMPPGRAVYPITNIPLNEVDYDRDRVHSFSATSFFWSPDSRIVVFADGSGVDDTSSIVSSASAGRTLVRTLAR